MYAPLLRPAVCLIAGILLGDQVTFPFPPFLPVVLVIAWMLLEQRRSSRFNWMFARSAVAHLSYLAIGITAARFTHIPPSEVIPGKYCGELEVFDKVSNKTKVSRAFARLTYRENDSIVERKVLLVTFGRDSLPPPSLREKAVYRFHGKLSTFKPAVNPHAFDAAAYYSAQDLSGELIADSLTLVRLPGEASLREAGRAFLDSALASLTDNEVRALYTALLSGDKRNLSHDVRNAFSRCGMMHLLAVSGLHVGLIALLPLYLLRKSRRLVMRCLSFTLVLLLVWGFAWFTGFPASVQRAGATLTLFALGSLFNMRTSGLNLLAGAAILLVVLDPSLPYDIGFQLSFTAVAAILVWGPVIQERLPQQRPWQRYLASSSAVSIAAQAGTTPFSLYYFHQFPVLFLPVNLIAVPFATLLMYMLLATVALFSLGLHPEWLVAGLQHGGRWLIDGALFTSNQTFCAIDGLFLSAAEAAGWGVLFALIFFRWKRRSRIWVLACCTVSVLLLLAVHRNDQRTEFTVFGQSRTALIGIAHRDRYLLITCSKYQSTYPASGWLRAMNAEHIILDSDTSFRWNSVTIENTSDVMRIGPLVIHDGSKRVKWDGTEVQVKKNAALISDAAGQMFAWNLSKDALRMRLSSTGQVVEVYGRRRPPIPLPQRLDE